MEASQPTTGQLMNEIIKFIKSTGPINTAKHEIKPENFTGPINTAKHRIQPDN